MKAIRSNGPGILHKIHHVKSISIMDIIFEAAGQVQPMQQWHIYSRQGSTRFVLFTIDNTYT